MHYLLYLSHVIFLVASLVGLDLDNIYPPLFPPNEPVSISGEIIPLIVSFLLVLRVAVVVHVVIVDLCCWQVLIMSCLQTLRDIIMLFTQEAG